MDGPTLAITTFTAMGLMWLIIMLFIIYYIYRGPSEQELREMKEMRELREMWAAQPRTTYSEMNHAPKHVVIILVNRDT